jgi:hypothetical protein
LAGEVVAELLNKNVMLPMKVEGRINFNQVTKFSANTSSGITMSTWVHFSLAESSVLLFVL